MYIMCSWQFTPRAPNMIKIATNQKHDIISFSLMPSNS